MGFAPMMFMCMCILPGSSVALSADSELLERMERIEEMLIAMGAPDMREYTREEPPANVAEARAKTSAHDFRAEGEAVALIAPAPATSPTEPALSHAAHRRLSSSWRVMDAIREFSQRFEDYIGEVLRMASNLVYVGAMALGFAVLPTPLMLLLAGIGVFGPLAIYLATGWVLALLGSAASATSTTVFLIGPKLAAVLLSLISLCFTLAATLPELAIFLMWLAALFSSRLFQHAALAFELDLNNDGTVGWVRNCVSPAAFYAAWSLLLPLNGSLSHWPHTSQVASSNYLPPLPAAAARRLGLRPRSNQPAPRRENQ